jgi:hypothetical protein
MEYIGYMIIKEGVSIDSHKVEVMLNWPILTNIKQLRGFLGLIGYYKKFVKGYGEIYRPLTQLLKKDSFG